MVYSNNSTRDNVMGLAGAGLGGWGGVMGLQAAKAAYDRNNILNRTYGLNKQGRKDLKAKIRATRGGVSGKGITGSYQGKQNKVYYDRRIDPARKLLLGGPVPEPLPISYDGFTKDRYSKMDKSTQKNYRKSLLNDIGIDSDGGYTKQSRPGYSDARWYALPKNATDQQKKDFKAIGKNYRSERRLLGKALAKEGNMNAMGGFRGDLTRAQDFNWKKGFNKTNRKALLAGGRLAGGGLIGAGLGYGLGVASSKALNSLGWQG